MLWHSSYLLVLDRKFLYLSRYSIVLIGRHSNYYWEKFSPRKNEETSLIILLINQIIIIHLWKTKQSPFHVDRSSTPNNAYNTNPIWQMKKLLLKKYKTKRKWNGTLIAQSKLFFWWVKNLITKHNIFFNNSNNSLPALYTISGLLTSNFFFHLFFDTIISLFFYVRNRNRAIDLKEDAAYFLAH